MCAKLQYRCKHWDHQFSGKNEFAPPRLEPGSSDCRSECSTTELQSETSFHRLCCAFIVSVSLQ